MYVRMHMRARAHMHACVHVLAITHITYTFDSDYTYAIPKLQDAQQPEPEDYPKKLLYYFIVRYIIAPE